MNYHRFVYDINGFAWFDSRKEDKSSKCINPNIAMCLLFQTVIYISNNSFHVSLCKYQTKEKQCISDPVKTLSLAPVIPVIARIS